MPVTRMKIEELPKAKRRRRSVLLDTPEYAEVKAILADGLKPGEAIEVVLSPEIRNKRKYATRLFRDLVAADIKRLKLEMDVFTRFTSKNVPAVVIHGRIPNIA